MSIEWVVEDTDASNEEIGTSLKELGFRREDKGSWLYRLKASYRGVYAYRCGRGVAFRTYAGRNENDTKMQMEAAITIVEKFGGKLRNSLNGQYLAIGLTRREKTENIERMLMK